MVYYDLKSIILSYVFKNQSLLENIYIGIGRTDEDGNFVEVNQPSYQRALISRNNNSWIIDEDTAELSNNIEIRFSEANETWATSSNPLTAWCFFNGNSLNSKPLFSGTLIKQQVVPRFGTFIIPKGGLTMNIFGEEDI